MLARLRFGCAAVAVSALVWSCGDDGNDAESTGCVTGSLRCACYRNDTCDAPYQCFSNRCVLRGGGGEGGGGTLPTDGGSSDGGSVSSAAGERGEPSGGAGPSQGGSSGGPSSGGSSGKGGASGGAAPNGGRAQAGMGGEAPNANGGAAGSGGDGGVSAGAGTASEGGAAGDAGNPSETGGVGGAGGAGGAGNLPSNRVFFDDFEDLVDDGWAAKDSWKAAPDPTDTSNGVYIATAPQGSGICSAIAGDPSWTNVLVEAKVKFVDVVGPTSTAAYVGARYQDLARGDYIYVYPSGTGFVMDNRVEDNVSYGNAANFTVEVSEDVWHTLALKVVGTTGTGYFDGEQVAVLEGLTQVNGPIGLCAGPGVVYFDDVTVTLIDE